MSATRFQVVLSASETDGSLAASAVALVEQNDAVRLRVELPPLAGRAAGARPAVHHDDGLARGVPADLPIDAVAVADIEKT
jgi:hypothetical protein